MEVLDMILLMFLVVVVIVSIGGYLYYAYKK